MRKTNLFFALVSFLLCVCANAKKIESGSCGENVKYTLYDSGLLVIKGKGEMKNYVLTDFAPWGSQSVKQVKIKKGVTSIGKWAFENCFGLTSITIPNSVTSIGNDAFYDCSGLTSITIPNSVTSIGYDAFNDCFGLTSITIPNSVTSIGEGAFARCSELTSLSVESGNTKYDSRDNCNAIIETETNTLIAGCCNTVIPNSVTSIGDGAFTWCSGLTSITIPNSVTCIGKHAFEDCLGLTSITIPNSVTCIGDDAFYSCSRLTSLSVESGNTKYDSRDSCNAIIETETNTLIAGCRNTVIPNSVTSIGEGAFAWCSELTSITIPNSVTSIGEGAFAWCSELTSITIPNSVTSIGEGAFKYCSGLTSITIPNSVTSIGEWAFTHCSNISTIYCYATTPPTADSCPFDGKNYDSAILYVPKGTKKDYASSECWGIFQNIVEMEDGK